MKNTITRSIWEFFCPYYCISCGKVGGILCNCCKKYIISGNNWKCLCCGDKLKNRICEKCALPFREQFYIGGRCGLLKDLINCYKYQSIRTCGWVFAELLGDLFGGFLQGKIVVPLPTIKKHVRERGSDHTGRFAVDLSRACGGEVRKVIERSYALVDDIWTTGSSMTSACMELQKVGVKDISIIVLAKSE